MLASHDLDRPARRAGLGVVELIVIVAVVGFLVLGILVMLPRGRETARMASCQKNLMQIGVATQLYLQANRHYPSTSPLGVAGAGDSPVEAMLKALTLPDFIGLRDPSRAPKPSAAAVRGTRVAGLTCPSDPAAGSGPTSTSLSYRANVGDATDASTGPFSPGAIVTLERVEAADGLSFTAGFAERLVGTGTDGRPGPANYVEVPGPVDASCGQSSGNAARWRGDAGSSWADSSWRSALYAHATPPNAAITCVAEDGKTATMTAASAHPGRINVWMLDGSLRGVTPTIDPAVWRALGSIGAVAPSPEPVR